MPVPTYDKFIEPILRVLYQNPDGLSAREAHEQSAAFLKLTEKDKQELLPSGVQPMYKNRAGWAHDRLKRAGLSKSPRRGFWQLTDKGIDLAKSYPEKIPLKIIDEITTRYSDVKLKNDNSHKTPEKIHHEDLIRLSPEERMEQAVSEVKETVSEEIIDALMQVSPSHFETIVLDLLHRMGYGATRNDLERVGGSGDAGIDGVISLDKLGLEKVYVQAKRWKNTVGRPEIQGFYGALAGQRAIKGVFITTSNYSLQAIGFANSVEGIILVDGSRLAKLMIDHEIGVSSRVIKVPKLDSDYFDEDSL